MGDCRSEEDYSRLDKFASAFSCHEAKPVLHQLGVLPAVHLSSQAYLRDLPAAAPRVRFGFCWAGEGQM